MRAQPARKCCSPAASSPMVFARPTLSVPAIHCGACIRTIEKALGGLAGVESARVNLSTKRVTVRWRADGAPPPFDRDARTGRLRGSFVRRRVRQQGRRTVRTDTRARGRGLRREQHHAAFGVDLVGRRSRDPRSVSLAVGDHRAARAGIFRPDILPVGLAGPEARTHQHGRADLPRRAARLRHEFLRDGACMARTPISTPRSRCCSSC